MGNKETGNVLPQIGRKREMTAAGEDVEEGRMCVW